MASYRQCIASWRKKPKTKKKPHLHAIGINRNAYFVDIGAKTDELLLRYSATRNRTAAKTSNSTNARPHGLRNPLIAHGNSKEHSKFVKDNAQRSNVNVESHMEAHSLLKMIKYQKNTAKLNCYQSRKRRIAKSRKNRPDRVYRPKGSSSHNAPDLKQFDRLLAEGQLDANLVADERKQMRKQEPVLNRSRNPKKKRKAKNCKDPIILSTCDPSKTLSSFHNPQKRPRSRSGGGGNSNSTVKGEPYISPANENLRRAESQLYHVRTRWTHSTPTAFVDLTDQTSDDSSNGSIQFSSQETGVVDLAELPHAAGPLNPTSKQMKRMELTVLSEEENLLAESLLHSKRSKKLSTIESVGITLRGEDFSRLDGTGWLNDELMNAYMALINEREDRYWNSVESGEKEPIDGRPRSYCFNTFFFTRLGEDSIQPSENTYDYKGVSRWTKRAKVDILELDNVIVPINVGRNHWILVIIDIEEKTLFFIDSLYRRDRTVIIPTLMRWLYDEVCDKHGPEIAEKFKLEKLESSRQRYRVRRDLNGLVSSEREQIARVPIQQDGGSCGVYAAKMADCVALGVEACINAGDIPVIRKRMAIDLYSRVLPG